MELSWSYLQDTIVPQLRGHVYTIDDFNDQKINKISKISSIFKASNKSSSKVFETLKISSKNDIQNDHEKETIQQMKESVNVICMVYIVGVIDYSPQNYKREYNGGDGISVLQPNAMLTINKAVAQQAIGNNKVVRIELYCKQLFPG
ncbi:kinase-like domain-containing protein [Rhizophagus irregularis DAOM 181602=DAOM 197198]|nr:kinase-like domain-containing protein [Rhizophagus irregularis DAOM 181602=DAOM 197198]